MTDKSRIVTYEGDKLLLDIADASTYTVLGDPPGLLAPVPDIHAEFD